MADGSCDSDADCVDLQCCSQYGFCGATAEHCEGRLRCLIAPDCVRGGDGSSESAPFGGCCGLDGYCVSCGAPSSFPPTTSSPLPPQTATTDAPSTPSPISAPPTTSAPASSSPTTSGPTLVPTGTPTAAPATDGPTTASPSTSTPTNGPTTTEPTTNGPTTAFPTTFAPTETDDPTVEPTPSPSVGSATLSPAIENNSTVTNSTNVTATASPTASPVVPVPTNDTAATNGTAAPSSPPSSSAVPTSSSNPSAPPTAAPTPTKVSRTRTLPGGAEVTECVFPDDRYDSDTPVSGDAASGDVPDVTSANLTAVSVDFWYSINVDPTNDLGATLRAMEGAIHDGVVANKLDCEAVRRRRRRQRRRTTTEVAAGSAVERSVSSRRRMPGQSHPSAISTLKDDVVANGQTCDDSQLMEGYDCHVIDGGITSYYRESESVIELDARTDLLAFVKDGMNDGGVFNEVDGVGGVSFIGAPILDAGGGEESNVADNAGSPPSTFQRVWDSLRGEENNSITWLGGLFIGAMCALFLGVIYVCIRTRRYVSRSKTERVVDGDDEYDGEDADSRTGIIPEKSPKSTGVSPTKASKQVEKEASFDVQQSLDRLYDEPANTTDPLDVEHSFTYLPDKDLVHGRAEEARAVVLNDVFGEDSFLEDEMGMEISLSPAGAGGNGAVDANGRSVSFSPVRDMDGSFENEEDDHDDDDGPTGKTRKSMGVADTIVL